MARYVVVDDDNNAGRLTAIIIGIIVIAVVAYFAMYALAIALGIILLISCVIGTILTIRNYIVALRDSLRSYAHAPKPSGWIVPTFVYRWIKISWETIKGAWSYNIGSIKDFFGKIGFYKFLSFKKWIYLFSGLSILVFGSIVSLFILLLHLYLIIVVIELVIVVAIVALAIFGLIGLGVSVAVSTTNYITRISESYCSSAAILSAYITQCGYSEYIQVIKNYVTESINYIKDGFSQFITLPFLSFKKWLRLGSSIMTIIVGSIMLLIFATVHILILPILFAFFKIVSLFHR